MQRSILTYGLIAGAIIITVNTLSFELGLQQEWLGFLVMFIVFSLIFVAVKQYREQQLAGVISFGKAFILGLGISSVACLVYVILWEIYLSFTGSVFLDAYIESVIEANKFKGLTNVELAEVMAEMEQLRENYANPLIRIPLTALEIFPVGLFVSLTTAVVLRNHKSNKS